MLLHNENNISSLNLKNYTVLPENPLNHNNKMTSGIGNYISALFQGKRVNFLGFPSGHFGDFDQ